MEFNITILLGGGVEKTEVIEASKYVISSDGMVKFYNQEGELTHCYPSTRIYFTIEYDEFNFN
jgi:hypothetical protein